ncbi:MAG: hypothetical protein GY794_22170 [bacterium]|nr:hypothetical protein [bacterium]
MKLTPQQIEEILSGQMPQGDDLDAEDLAAIEEARAIRSRLASAFDSTHASDSLADKVRAGLQNAPVRKRRFIYFPTGIFSVATAAAMLILVPVLYFSLMGPASAMAGKLELANIHKVNLAGPEDFYATGDCEEIKAYFKEKLGFTPKLLNECPKLRIVGCHLARLNGKMVATYVVQLDDQKASVIISEESPKKLGLDCNCGNPHCKCIHGGQCEGLSIVSVRFGDRSYSVVGNLPEKSLRSVLERIAN